MGILETFSKRKRRLEKAGQQDIYQYDELPYPFRVQVAHIWDTAIGRYFVDSYRRGSSSPANEWWQYVHDTLAREQGVFRLGGEEYSSPKEMCIVYLLSNTTSVFSVLDIIELRSGCLIAVFVNCSIIKSKALG